MRRCQQTNEKRTRMGRPKPKGTGMTAWFALMTKALQEQLARDDLRRRGFEVFWMYTSEWVGTGHKAKSRLVKRSWLSRYLFVHADPLRLSEVQDERARTMGVATVVHATNH